MDKWNNDKLLFYFHLWRYIMTAVQCSLLQCCSNGLKTNPCSNSCWFACGRDLQNLPGGRMDGDRTLDSFCMFAFSLWTSKEKEKQGMCLCIYSWERPLVMEGHNVYGRPAVTILQTNISFLCCSLTDAVLLCPFDHSITTVVLFSFSISFWKHNSVPIS